MKNGVILNTLNVKKNKTIWNLVFICCTVGIENAAFAVSHEKVTRHKKYLA